MSLMTNSSTTGQLGYVFPLLLKTSHLHNNQQIYTKSNAKTLKLTGQTYTNI